MGYETWMIISAVIGATLGYLVPLIRKYKKGELTGFKAQRIAFVISAVVAWFTSMLLCDIYSIDDNSAGYILAFLFGFGGVESINQVFKIIRDLEVFPSNVQKILFGP
jgi:hypothetical protein